MDYERHVVAALETAHGEGAWQVDDRTVLHGVCRSIAETSATRRVAMRVFGEKVFRIATDMRQKSSAALKSLAEQGRVKTEIEAVVPGMDQPTLLHSLAEE